MKPVDENKPKRFKTICSEITAEDYIKCGCIPKPPKGTPSVLVGDYVQDSHYVHTDNNYSDLEKAKNNIVAGEGILITLGKTSNKISILPAGILETGQNSLGGVLVQEKAKPDKKYLPIAMYPESGLIVALRQTNIIKDELDQSLIEFIEQQSGGIGSLTDSEDIYIVKENNEAKMYLQEHGFDQNIFFTGDSEYGWRKDESGNIIWN